MNLGQSGQAIASFVGYFDGVRPAYHALRPFDLASSDSIGIIQWLLDLDECYRTSTTTKQKLQYLVEKLLGDARTLVTSKLDAHAAAQAKRNGFTLSDGIDDEGRPVFETPFKHTRYVSIDDAGETDCDYDPPYTTVKAIVTKAILGNSAMLLLNTHLSQVKQNGTSIQAHAAYFQSVVQALRDVGGPSGDKWFAEQFLSSVDPHLLDPPTNLNANTLQAAIKTVVLASERSARFNSLQGLPSRPSQAMKYGSSLSQDHARLLPPKDTQLQKLNPRLVYTGNILSFTLDPAAEPAVKGLAKLLSETTTEAAALNCIQSFVSTSGDKRLFPAEDMLNTDVSVTDFCKDVAKKISEGSGSVFETVCAIHHLLPERVVKETSRSTTITSEHSLGGKSKKELRRDKARKRAVDNTTHDESDDDSDDDEELDEKPSRRKNPKRGVAAAMAAIREECDAWKQCALGLKTNSVAPLTIETVASFSQQRNPSPAPYQNKPPWSPPLPAPPQNKPAFRPYVHPERAANMPDYTNKNTEHNRGQRPFSGLEANSFKGCKRCWRVDHFTKQCPPLAQGVQFCNYCHKDGHADSICPVLAGKTCTTCHARGHTPNFCPQQRCSICSELGHNERRCQKK